ncbi:hypothetical protein LQ327_31500 [Actinomycetospora endophytica]|uniref:TetR family transcriptional regulator n=1 Tax=Actinomycetospora endophytica TaxID=2291215 RepID=A0ABS8PI27_9PSEU|nr:hypothetical protein [Actinomycetospora endophytica]MCD2197905.1 hypothetical protein [Actinomycetospora endophytica]
MGEYDDWTAEAARLLGALGRERVPAFEYALIDGLAKWLFSDANPGADYDDDAAAQVISVLFGAFSDAHEIEPPTSPPDDDGVGTARDALVAGAHQLSEGPGVTTLIMRVMPAIKGELTAHTGDPGKQLHSAYFYLLLAVASGTGELGSPEVAEGLLASFTGWDGLFASGAVPRPTPQD